MYSSLLQNTKYSTVSTIFMTPDTLNAPFHHVVKHRWNSSGKCTSKSLNFFPQICGHPVCSCVVCADLNDCASTGVHSDTHVCFATLHSVR